MINGFYSYQTPRGLIKRTIYTPVHAVFEDIRRATGAGAICLPDFKHSSTAVETALKDESPCDTLQTRIELSSIPSSPLIVAINHSPDDNEPPAKESLNHTSDDNEPPAKEPLNHTSDNNEPPAKKFLNQIQVSNHSRKNSWGLRLHKTPLFSHLDLQ